MEHITGLIEDAKHDMIKERLRIRRARITNNMGVITVGGPTPVEREEKHYRIDDALCATKAALEDGVLPGGGTAYLRCIDSIDMTNALDEGETDGMSIVCQALEKPLYQILLNAGMEVAEIAKIITTVRTHNKGAGYGYNAKSEVFEDLFASGVIDPLKVSKVALEKAASIAGMFLTTEAVISDSQ